MPFSLQPAAATHMHMHHSMESLRHIIFLFMINGVINLFPNNSTIR